MRLHSITINGRARTRLYSPRVASVFSSPPSPRTRHPARESARVCVKTKLPRTSRGETRVSDVRFVRPNRRLKKKKKNPIRISLYTYTHTRPRYYIIVLYNDGLSKVSPGTHARHNAGRPASGDTSSFYNIIIQLYRCQHRGYRSSSSKRSRPRPSCGRTQQ